MGGDKVPTTVWFDYIDEWRQVSDRDSFLMARRMAHDEGMFLGGSAGMNVQLALDIAREIDDPDACVVTILTDTGERYLSKQFNDDWMRENQYLDLPRVTVGDLLHRRTSGAPPLVSVAPAAAVRQALNLMTTWEVSQVPVVDDGRCIGSLVEGSLMTRSLEEPSVLDRPVRDIMGNPLPVVESTTPSEAMFPTTLKLNDDLLKTLIPSNDRSWTPEQAVLAHADIEGDRVTVHNIRDCRWRSFDDFTISRYDKTFDLDKLTWLWEYTTREDEYIILRNSEGVNSRFFEPGPYQPEFEEPSIDFIAWYLENLKDDRLEPA